MSDLKKKQLLINRNFALLWSGRAVSFLGDFILDTTLVIWITTHIAYRQSWGPLAVSGLFLVNTIPAFLFGPLAGVFVDRWNKKVTMLLMDTLRALFLLLLSLLSIIFLFNQSISIFWQLSIIYSFVFLIGTCSQFFNPASLVLVGDIVPESLQAHASGLVQTMANLVTVIGPSLASVLFFLIGPWWAFVFDAITFIASFLFVLQIDSSNEIVVMTDKGNKFSRIFHDFHAGLQFFAKNQILSTVLITMCCVLLGGGISQTLNIFFITQNLHADPRLYGFLGSASGIGLIVGALLSSSGIQRIGLAQTFWLSVLLLGALEIVYTKSTNLLFALTVLFFQGIPNSALNVTFGPLILQTTPRIFVGRVWALLTPAMNIASMISAPLSGYLANAMCKFPCRKQGS